MQPIIPRIVPLDSAEDGISILIHFSVFLDPPGLLSRYSIRSLENREAIELFLAICLSIPFHFPECRFHVSVVTQSPIYSTYAAKCPWR